MADTGFEPMAVIVAMGLVTYLLRAGGYFVMGRIRLTPAVRRGLEALPGAIIVSTVLPVALRGGPVAALGLAVAALVMVVVRKDILAVAAGVGAAAFARSLGF